MEKKDNLSNSENINIESIGPSTDDLKNRFKAESIPLQTDYSDLIDIADIGRKATGQAFGQTPSQDPTLELDSNDLLIVKIDPDGGLKRSIKGLGIKLTDSDQTKTGLSLTSSGLKVDSGLGIILTEGHGVSIQLTDSNDQTNTGLFLTTDGLRVDPGKGIKLETGHGVSVGEGNGIQVNPDDIAVKPKTNGGISVDTDGVSVKLKPNSGINVDTDGISIRSSNGIITNADGVSVKPKPNSGISANADGVSVLCWEGGGIRVTDSTGIYLKLEGGDTSGSSGTSGLSLSTNGVKVKAGNGINVDTSGVSIKLANSDQTLTGLSLTSSGLQVDDGLGIVLTKDHGISVGAGNGIQVNTNNVAVKAKTNGGIKVDQDGVSVDIQSIASALANLIIPSGTIVPFYSNGSLPNGWVWCDGSNGTPDLNTNRNGHDSGDNINLISGWGDIHTDFWQLGSGKHIAANIYYMRYIMKK
ncbi:hypothetical protein [Photorhabdus hindustanensis]|uniref:Avian adenovirus fibre N-terminal domain-containing protein n=1 Tax=Photorhabdus hindustanensis TaxID=2918802 RepID=A0A2S8PXV3_9GAMM|nr:hypothetical protein [Photorhabdus hindustanensis]PQQ23929.1 hypothetical protein C6H66_17400 [Photorhabdus hindustanensis]